MLEAFEYYKSLGLDIQRLTCGCAVKVDLYTVVYPALRRIIPELESWGITIGPREDADIFKAPSDIEIARRIYPFKGYNINSKDIKKISPKRALLFMQIYQRNAEPNKLAKMMLNFYREISKSKISLHIGKGHTILTTLPEKQFILLDFIRYIDKLTEGYVTANNDTLQIIDPTRLPYDSMNVSVIINNALNDLFSLGVFENLEVHPLYDSPKEEATELIRKSMIDYSDRLKINIYDHGSLGIGSLIIGASVFGHLYKEPPTFYNKLSSGMKILIHRPLGELALINAYLVTCFSDFMVDLMEKASSVNVKEVFKVKEKALRVMAQSNLRVAKIINKFLPQLDGEFRPDEHIAVTVDLSGPGILTFKEVAKLAKVDITLWDAPLLDEGVVRFVVDNYLVPNGTAGTNGAIALIASEEIVEQLDKELRCEGYSPEIIGEVEGKGTGTLKTGRSVASLIAQPSLLSELKVVDDLDVGF